MLPSWPMKVNPPPFVLALLLATLLHHPMDSAQADSRRDIIEHMFGAGRTNAVGGHGGLTIGVANDGDLTVLSWPSPGLRDHLAYFTSNAIDARSRPRFGAHEGMGSFLGLRLTIQNSPDKVITWLRDEGWVASQGYSAPLAPIPQTTFVNETLGLTVILTDIVSPDVSVFTRHMQVEVADSSTITNVELVLYENLAPSVSLIEQLPVGDWALDPVSDYLAIWDESSQAVLHHHPSDVLAFVDLVSLLGLNADVDYGAVESLMRSSAPTEADVAATVAAMDSDYEAGVSALVTTEPAPVERQIGSDATPLCGHLDELLDNLVTLPEKYPNSQVPLDAQTADALRCTEPLERIRADHEWQWLPEDALADLADGTLSGSMVAAARTNAALIAPMEPTDTGFSGSAVFAFGTTVSEARAALQEGQSTAAAERLAASEARAVEELGEARLPDPSLGDRVLEISRRALVNMYVARDRETGAIVASVSRQPPYFLDWPRDGAFFSAALDVADLEHWATQRFEWYTTIQRRQFTAGLPVFTPEVPIDPDSGEQLFPRYAWEMNYYTNGKIGGPIRFEIDNSALHIWSIALHAAHLPEDERQAFVDSIWQNTADALDTLVRWRDAETGLPALANEDDHLELTSKLHGAVTVYASLEAGARLAVIAGEPKLGRAYMKRARELRKAILEYYFDDELGLFRTTRDGEAGAHTGSTAWLVWPARLLDQDDPALQAQLDADMELALQILDFRPGGGQYQSKNIVSAALYGDAEGARAQAVEALNELAGVATTDTHIFGEVYVPVTLENGSMGWSNRTGAPHIWSGILFYLSAMALTNPDDFKLDDQELALPDPAGGCGCRAGQGAGGTGALFACFLAIVLIGRWSRARR